MSLSEIKTALGEAIGAGNVYHYRAPQSVVSGYAVWGEHGKPQILNAGDKGAEYSVSVDIFFYTVEEFDQRVDKILAALDAHGIVWSLDDIGFDETTECQAYTITASIYTSGGLYGGQS